MFNIANILEGLEKLVFEVLTWVLLVPKTLIKILWDPDWVSVYVEEELSKKEERFTDYMSPFLLLVLITIGLYGLIEITGLNYLEIKGPATALVGETTAFYTNPTFRWNGAVIGEVWWVDNATLNTEYRLIRYNSNLSQHVDFEKFVDMIDDENSFRDESIVEVKDEIPQTHPGKFEYTWQQPGLYRITAAYWNRVGEPTANLPPHEIVILEKGESYAPLPDFGDNQIDKSVFENKERTFLLLWWL